jgi:hypothetical protein
MSQVKANLLNNTSKVTLKLISNSLTHSHTHSLTQSLTHSPIPWNKVRLENITVYQLVKKFLTFYATREFNSTFTIVRQLSLS